MRDLFTMSVTEDGGLQLVPGPAFGDEHAPLLVAMVAAASPVLDGWKTVTTP